MVAVRATDTSLFDAPTVVPDDADTPEQYLAVVLDHVGDPDRLRAVVRCMYRGGVVAHGRWLDDLAGLLERISERLGGES